MCCFKHTDSWVASCLVSAGEGQVKQHFRGKRKKPWWGLWSVNGRWLYFICGSGLGLLLSWFLTPVFRCLVCLFLRLLGPWGTCVRAAAPAGFAAGVLQPSLFTSHAHCAQGVPPWPLPVVLEHGEGINCVCLGLVPVYKLMALSFRGWSVILQLCFTGTAMHYVLLLWNN